MDVEMDEGRGHTGASAILASRGGECKKNHVDCKNRPKRYNKTSLTDWTEFCAVLEL